MILLDKPHPQPSICCVLLGILLIFSPISIATSRVGLVKTYEPKASLIRQGLETNLEIGAEIFQGDTIFTDSEGSIGIIFSDGTELTLGPGGKLFFEGFMFKPEEQKIVLNRAP